MMPNRDSDVPGSLVPGSLIKIEHYQIRPRNSNQATEIKTGQYQTTAFVSLRDVKRAPETPNPDHGGITPGAEHSAPDPSRVGRDDPLACDCRVRRTFPSKTRIERLTRAIRAIGWPCARKNARKKTG
jgi:hypothetical protein